MRSTLSAVVSLAILLFSGFPLRSLADQPSLSVAGELLPAEELLRGGADPADPVVYSRYSDLSQLEADSERPHLGTALTYVGDGPQLRISSVRVFIYSQVDQTYGRIRVQIKFWNAYNGAASPVFSQPSPGVLGVDLIGPYILEADKLYAATVTLPEPLLLDANQSVGISARVLVGALHGDLAEVPSVLPVYDTGGGGVGTSLANYADLSGTRSDYNFASTDTFAHPLAIVLYGQSQRMVQCGNWPRYRTHMVEEFDVSDNTFNQRWNTLPNAGSAAFGADGGYILSAASGPTFPYARSLGTPIPPSGEFSIRWSAKYLSAATNGTGSLVISQGLPQNGSPDNLASRAAWAWQDSNQGFHVKARSGADPNPSAAFHEPASGNAVTHDIEYCWLDSSVELWVDGVRVLQQARTPDVPRPDSLWFGNHTNTGASSGWNAVEIYRIYVRVPYGDLIFASGFE